MESLMKDIFEEVVTMEQESSLGLMVLYLNMMVNGKKESFLVEEFFIIVEVKYFQELLKQER
jgi:hypothetical protein